MGKTKSFTWKYYRYIESDGKYSCCFCKSKFSKSATRLQRHLQFCKKTPQTVKNKCVNDQKVADDSDSDADFAIELTEFANADVDLIQSQNKNSSEIVQSVGAVEAQTSNKSSSGPIRKFFDCISISEKNEIDILLARAIYETGTPLHIVSSPAWKALFKKLRPAYDLPSRYIVSNRLLNEEFDRVKSKIDKKIAESKMLYLQTDAWSNIRRDSITNYVVNTPDPVFYKSVHTEENRHTAVFLADEIVNVLEDIGPQRFLTIVTDNGSNIKAAKIEVCKKFTHMVKYGCICHTLSLLTNDILNVESTQKLRKVVTNISSEIKNSTVLHAAFERIQRDKRKNYISLKLPVQTR